MTKDEALRLALEALKSVADHRPNEETNAAIAAIKQALEQPEPEPVAYGMWDTQLGRGNRMMMVRLDKGQDGCTIPLYAKEKK